MILPVADASQVAAARRAAGDIARQRGFDEEQTGTVSLIATEMASNLLKHAGRGELVVQGFDDGSGAGLELLSLDRGDGIADVARALQDGYSTAGSPGTGLGAIRRQAHEFDIYSRPGLGTAIMVRLRQGARAGPAGGPVVGAVAAPYPGETVCGDAWALGVSGGKPTILVVDGSGHGPAAQAAALAAVDTFRARLGDSAPRLMEEIHRALAPTRGAAVALAQVDPGRQVVGYVGLGNITAALATPAAVRRMVSHSGIAGYRATRIREFTYPYGDGGIIVMHSDGVATHWDLGQYPGLLMSHPSLIAGVLYRDHHRSRDDATVVAARI